MKIKIITIPNMISPHDWEPLKNVGEVEYIEQDKISENDLLDQVKDTDYLLLNYDVVEEITERFYKTIKDNKYPLKAISTDITGMTWAKPELAKKYGVKLVNTPKYSSLSVAEFTITSLQLMIKKMHLAFHDKLEGEESQDYKNAVFQGQTLGIVGLGDIGLEVAKLAQGIGMNVLAWNRSPKKQDGVEMVEDLGELFSKSDHISINLKTTEETKKLITKEHFLSMNGGYIINQADHKLVNFDHIVEAIKAGKVAGYSGSQSGLADHELGKMREVISFPAQAWFTDHSLNRLREIWVNNILQAESGKYPNLVEE